MCPQAGTRRAAKLAQLFATYDLWIGLGASWRRCPQVSISPHGAQNGASASDAASRARDRELTLYHRLASSFSTFPCDYISRKHPFAGLTTASHCQLLRRPAPLAAARARLVGVVRVIDHVPEALCRPPASVSLLCQHLENSCFGLAGRNAFKLAVCAGLRGGRGVISVT